jgi:hypothetical protein
LRLTAAKVEGPSKASEAATQLAEAARCRGVALAVAGSSLLTYRVGHWRFRQVSRCPFIHCDRQPAAVGGSAWNGRRFENFAKRRCVAHFLLSRCRVWCEGTRWCEIHLLDRRMIVAASLAPVRGLAYRAKRSPAGSEHWCVPYHTEPLGMCRSGAVRARAHRGETRRGYVPILHITFRDRVAYVTAPGAIRQCSPAAILTIPRDILANASRSGAKNEERNELRATCEIHYGGFGVVTHRDGAEDCR